MEVNVDINDSPFSQSPVAPTMYDGSKLIQFRCHKDIACFNACCRNMDITLTPYDVLRLKNRLGLDSGEFLKQYTVPFEIEKDGLAGVKFRPVEGGTACRFMTEAGCSVYEDRPTACRYYPVALLSMRKQSEFIDRDSYALVREDHCLGHNEAREISIDDYRREQGLDQYDELARGWRQLVLKKKSTGPAVGTPSLRSRQLFFMACYDLDRYRLFVQSGPFNETYDLDDAEKQLLAGDDTALMLFAFRFLRQVLFGEMSIALQGDAGERRAQRLREREENAEVQEIPPPGGE